MEKWKVNTIENKTGQCYGENKHSGGQVLSSRSKISQEAVEICQLDLRNLIPANIKHKYGSSLVNQLITPEQVRNCLEARTRNIHRVDLNRVTPKLCLSEECPHTVYYELSHCLRSNLFAGMPVKQQSLAHDSYTREVNDRGRLDKGHSQQWFGRKTDDLALWSQTVMERNAIAKILESQQKPFRVFPLRTYSTAQMDGPSPTAPPAMKSKKQHQAKANKSKALTPPVAEPDKDDDFWDFYDKPIP